MEDECPVCLEPLTGTTVHLDCCKHRIHIQCYISTCPFCRSELPVPTHCSKVEHIVVPVPVSVVRTVQPEFKKHLISVFISAAILGMTFYFISFS